MTLRISIILTLVLGTIVFGIHEAQAAVPALQVAPLQYEDTLTPGQVFSGYIDVANPTDATISVTSSVKGFRQTGADGDLEFFDDPELSAAIKPGLDSFSLGPREAVRVMFSVDSGKLPQGGTYAAVFFRTTPPEQTSAASYITESANVGTLLVLTNGAGAKHRGRVSGLNLPWLQLGSGITGAYTFNNTDTSARPVGFKPQARLRALPWAKAHTLPTGLVLARTSRSFAFSITGSYAGVLPISITDADTKTSRTQWVLVCTGWYRLVVPVGLLALVAVVWALRRRSRRRIEPNDETAETPK